MLYSVISGFIRDLFENPCLLPAEIKQSLVGKENKCVADISSIHPSIFPKSKIQFSA